MKRQPSQLRRHGEGDFDEIVEVGVAGDIAESADIVGLQRAQRAETIEHHARLGTNDIPTHVEQSASRCVEEKIDAFRLRNGAVSREGERIDPVEGEVIGAADQRLEFGDNARAPRLGLLYLGHLCFEEPLLNNTHDEVHSVNR